MVLPTWPKFWAAKAKPPGTPPQVPADQQGRRADRADEADPLVEVPYPRPPPHGSPARRRTADVTKEHDEDVILTPASGSCGRNASLHHQ